MFNINEEELVVYFLLRSQEEKPNASGGAWAASGGDAAASEEWTAAVVAGKWVLERERKQQLRLWIITSLKNFVPPQALVLYFLYNLTNFMLFIWKFTKFCFSIESSRFSPFKITNEHRVCFEIPLDLSNFHISFDSIDLYLKSSNFTSFLYTYLKSNFFF